MVCCGRTGKGVRAPRKTSGRPGSLVRRGLRHRAPRQAGNVRVPSPSTHGTHLRAPKGDGVAPLTFREVWLAVSCSPLLPWGLSAWRDYFRGTPGQEAIGSRGVWAEGPQFRLTPRLDSLSSPSIGFPALLAGGQT